MTPKDALKSDKFDKLEKMQWSSRSSAGKGPKRLCIFCLLAVCLPIICLVVPLYMRFQALRPHWISISPSDMKLLNQESMVSTFWCESQQVRMNTSFNAYLLDERPMVKKSRKRTTIKRRMVLKDDIKEYWGFYFLEGSVVRVKVCARYEGASFILVKSLKKAKKCDYLGELDSFEEVDEQSGELGQRMPSPVNSSQVTVEVMQEGNHSSFVDHSPHINSSSHFTDEEKIFQNYFSIFKNMPVEQRQVLLSNIAKAFKKEQSHTMARDERNSPNENDAGQEEIDDEDYPDEENVFGFVKNDRINQENGENNPDMSNEEVQSSWSSSEEALANCDGLLHNTPLNPSKECRINGSIESAQTEIVIRVEHTGFYYFIFASENEIRDNNLYATFDMKKTIFDVDKNKKESCQNATTCTLPLQFMSQDHVVLEAPFENLDQFNDCNDTRPSGISSLPECHRVMHAESVCIPRTNVYLIFMLLAPIFILIFANI